MRGGSRLRLMAPLAVLAILAGTAQARAGDDCLTLAAAAEQRFGIPPGLLQAIALTESGNAGTAWPWVLNAAGTPIYLPSRRSATRGAYAAMIRHGDNVAIGCMQLHMHWHAMDFGSLDEVVDPATNVAYAARFLSSLHQAHGSWVAAVRHYHGSEPAAQETYLCRVLRYRVSLGYQKATDGMQKLCD